MSQEKGTVVDKSSSTSKSSNAPDNVADGTRNNSCSDAMTESITQKGPSKPVQVPTSSIADSKRGRSPGTKMSHSTLEVEVALTKLSVSNGKNKPSSSPNITPRKDPPARSLSKGSTNSGSSRGRRKDSASSSSPPKRTPSGNRKSRPVSATKTKQRIESQSPAAATDSKAAASPRATWKS